MEHDPDGARGGLERGRDPVSVYFILFLGRRCERDWRVVDFADVAKSLTRMHKTIEKRKTPNRWRLLNERRK